MPTYSSRALSSLVAAVACLCSAGAFIPAPAFAQGGDVDPAPAVARMPRLRPEPAFAKGWVADRNGKPVAGVTVSLWSASNAGRHLFAKTKTDAKGVYRAPINTNYVYTITAASEREFDENLFQLNCNPVEMSEARSGREGIVQNFVLALSGLENTTDADRTNYYDYMGGAIWTGWNWRNNGRMPADTVVTITLEPVGPLADGSTGKTLTYRRTVGAVDTGPEKGRLLSKTCVLHDIPLGVYRMSAVAELAGMGKTPLICWISLGTGKGMGEKGETVTVHIPPGIGGRAGAAQVNLVHSEAIQKHLGIKNDD